MEMRNKHNQEGAIRNTLHIPLEVETRPLTGLLRCSCTPELFITGFDNEKKDQIRGGLGVVSNFESET